MRKLRGFLAWLAKRMHRDYAPCKYCGEIRSKNQMYHRTAYGWFCDEYHADLYWELTIW